MKYLNSYTELNEGFINEHKKKVLSHWKHISL